MNVFRQIILGAGSFVLMSFGSTRVEATSCESTPYQTSDEIARIERFSRGRNWEGENFRFLHLENFDGTQNPHTGSRVDFGGANLRAASFGVLSLTASNVRRVQFTGAHFDALLLEHSQLQEMNLEEAELKLLEIRQSQAFEMNAKKIRVKHFQILGSVMNHSNWSESELEDGNVSNITVMDSVDWHSSRQKRVRWSWVRFLKNDFSNVDVQNSIFENIVFDRSSLKEAKFLNTAFNNVTFKSVDLRGVDLSETDMSNVRFEGRTQVDCHTKLGLEIEEARSKGFVGTVPSCGGAE